MSQAELCCPICAAELTIEQLFAHGETRQAFARLVARSIPLGTRLLAYVGLFAPAKNRMAIARKVKLLEQILPDLERGAVERKGRDWPAPRHVWADAIEQMLDARDEGKLTLPLTSHGYLYEIIAGMADKAEAAAESDRERERRTRGSTSNAAPQAAYAAATSTIGMPALAPPAGPGTSPLVRRMQAEAARKTAASDSEGI